MTERHAVEATQHSGTGRGVKRRGLLAAAAALAAGIAATQMAQPVAAVSGTGDQGALILGSNPWYSVSNPGNANTPNQSYIATVLQATPNFQNYIGANSAQAVVLKVDASTAGGGNIDGIYALGTGTGAGVDASSTDGDGIYAQSYNRHGVEAISAALPGKGTRGCRGPVSSMSVYAGRSS